MPDPRPGDRIEDWEGDRATIVSTDPVRLIWDCRQDGAVVTPDPSFLAGGFTILEEDNA